MLLLFSLFLLILWNHMYKDKANNSCWKTTKRKLSTTRNRSVMGIYKAFDFLIFEVLKGFGLSPCHLLCPSDPKLTSSLLLITQRFP